MRGADSRVLYSGFCPLLQHTQTVGHRLSTQVKEQTVLCQKLTATSKDRDPRYYPQVYAADVSQYSPLGPECEETILLRKTEQPNMALVGVPSQHMGDHDDHQCPGHTRTQNKNSTAGSGEGGSIQ